MYDKLDRGAVVIHVNYTYRVYNCIHIGVCSDELANLVAAEKADREAVEATVRAEVVKREAVEASLAALTAQVAELTAYHGQVQVRVMLMLLVNSNYCCYYLLERKDIADVN